MKKSLSREPSNNANEEDVTSNSTNGATPSPQLTNEPVVRTTGRIKKPKAVFDPSDHYIPRANRLSTTATSQASTASSTNAERRSSVTKTNISPASSTAEPAAPVWPKEACIVCKKRESKRPTFATKNRMVSCIDCDLKIHKNCLKVEFEDLEYLLSHYKCDQCTSCCICEQKFTKADEEIIACTKCIKSFHITCFPSKIDKDEIDPKNWKCNKCSVIYNHDLSNGTTLPITKIREIIGGAEPVATTSTVTSTSSPKSTATPPPAISNTTSPESNKNNENTESISSTLKRPHEVENKKEDVVNNEAAPEAGPAEKRTKMSKTQSSNDQSLNSSNSSLNQLKSGCFSPNDHIDIPDVKEWSVDQVHEYFRKYFPKEAHVFKDEEIDGRSLLLLKRSDVVKKLAIKLGPSLRIYSLILKIQAQINDPTLGWNCGL